jgi:hypothetical protein
MFAHPSQGHDVWVMQKYFDQRYWYRRREDYSPSDLSAVERANADTIALARMRDLGYGVAPGMMYLFQSQPLSDSLLRAMSLYHLRILRNEVYARHGRRFETPWLRDYFKDQPWYKPRREFTVAELSEIEKANVKVIQAIEARRHEELSTKELTEYDLSGRPGVRPRRTLRSLATRAENHPNHDYFLRTTSTGNTTRWPARMDTSSIICPGCVGT